MQYYNPHFLICTCFGISKLFKRFPGTVGSILALPISYLVSTVALRIVVLLFPAYANNYLAHYTSVMLVLLALFFVGAYSSTKYSEEIGVKDSGEIIIDEIVAQSLVLFVTTPLTFLLLYTNIRGKVIYQDVVLIASISLSIILFRLFDIVKPWPIKLVESKVGGGLGVMLDDILAAIFTIIVYFAGLLIFIDFYAK